ncbi:MAG: nitroreductase family protein [Chthoniobacterales bacterium]
MPIDFPYRTRRTIKPNQMDGARAVPRELLLEILEDAHWAPTHGLTQPWRFHVFTDEARGRLVEALESLYDQLTPAAERREDKRAKLRANILGAPACIAVAARIEPGGKISELDEIAATSCAVQNLLLSAHQRGLGSFWSSAPVTCSPEFVAWLGMDATHRGLGIVYLGYAQDGVKAASVRGPLGERVFFHAG